MGLHKGRVPIEAQICCDSVWVPLVSYTNSKELLEVEEAHYTWVEDVAFMSTTVRGTFKAQMEFLDFPFDRQNLVIETKLRNNDASTVTYQIVDAQVHQRVVDQGVPGWKTADDPVDSRTVEEHPSSIQGGATEAEAKFGLGYVSLHVVRLSSEFIDK